MDLRLTITTPHDQVQVTVYNNRDEVIYNQAGSLHKVDLKKGIYTVRGELSGHIKEETILLRDKPEHISLQLEYFSSIPLANFSTSHEYYTDQINPLLTSRNIRGGLSSQLLVLFRYSSREHFLKSNSSQNDVESEQLVQLIRDIVLFRNEVGVESQESDWKIDSWGGSIGYCNYLNQGLYYIGYNGNAGGKTRLLPIYLFSNWTTLVFITLDKEPLFGSMRVMMAPIGEPFNPSDKEWFAVDYAADQLQNNRYSFTKKVRQTLLSKKFGNPLLGILFSYAVLLGNDRSDDDMVRKVLLNLEEEILPNADWPDLEVLKLLASHRFKTTINAQPFLKPPLVRAGIEWLTSAAIDQSDLLPEHSLICQLAPKLLVDCVWTSWEVSPSQLISIFPAQTLTKQSYSEVFRESFETKSKISWEEVGLMQLVEEQLSNPEKSNSLTLHELSAGLGLPPNAVRSIVKRLTADQSYCKEVFSTLKQHQSTKLDDSIVLDAIYDIRGQ